MLSAFVIDGFAIKMIGIGGASLISMIVLTALKKSTPILRFIIKTASIVLSAGVILLLLNRAGLIQIPDVNKIIDTIIDNIFKFFTPVFGLNI